MKDINLLVWLTQLGLSFALPFAGFLLLSIWLYRQFSLGAWVIVAGVVLGVFGAAGSIKSSLKAMEKMSKDAKGEKTPVSFNEHS